METLNIPVELTDLNTYIDAERSNRFMAANIKRQNTDIVSSIARVSKMPQINFKANVKFIWHCKNKRKDPDNISFAQKFVFDGLIIAGILENDGHNQINSIKHCFDFTGTGVDVIFTEVKE